MTRPGLEDQLAAKDDREPRKRRVKNAVRRVSDSPHPNSIQVLKPGLKLIRRMARDGHSNASIAAALGVGTSALRGAMRRQEEVQEALEVGRAGLEDELANILLEHARGHRGDNKTSVVAAIYLTKARCGWREGDQQETKPNIVIQLPAAQSPEAWAKAITVSQSPKGEQ